ncbi:hypothetical protein HYR99_20885 [Candidatus Poribacteria bacterium]|nr:hypothetical protein [Candidatus Poribacteria bacterium]
MSLIRFCYDTEGDILDITFGFGQPNQREGFELNDNIVLFVEKETDRPLGLMFISYSKLLEQKSLLLDYLAAMPQEQQHRLMKVLKHELLSPFLTLIEPVNREVRIGNPHVNEMAAVA